MSDPLRFVKRHHDAAVKHSCDGKLAAAVTQLCYAMDELITWAARLQENLGVTVEAKNQVYPPEAEKCPVCGEMARDFQPFFSPDEGGNWRFNNTGLFLCSNMHPWKYEAEEDEK